MRTTDYRSSPQEISMYRPSSKVRKLTIQYHTQREFRKLFKRVKIFETQRSIKRIKEARKKGEDTEQLENELELTKKVDLDHLSALMFFTKLKKDALRKENDVQAYLESHAIDDNASDAALRKVHSRFLSNKQMGTDSQDLLNHLRYMINGQEATKSSKQDKAKELQQQKHISQKPNLKSSLKPATEQEAHNFTRKVSFGANKDEDMHDSMDWSSIDGDSDTNQELDPSDELSTDQPRDMAMEASADDHSKLKVKDNGRVKAASEGKVPLRKGKHEGQVGGLEGTRYSSEEETQGAILDPYNDGYDSDGEPLDSITRDHSTASTRSVFLPSLSAGFTTGDSDASEDEWNSDGEADRAKGTQQKKRGVKALLDGRKNRLGQRQRRQLWEKIHGKKARHLGESARPGRKTTTDHASGSNRVPTSRAYRGGVTLGTQARNGIRQVPAGASSRTSAGTEKVDGRLIPPMKPDNKTKAKPAEELHPSWEAKRRQKELMTKALTPAAGTKIVFDDD